ncbi:MAG: hypothetical protein KAI44_04165 [Methylococcales bacterium]|nr:hypothetical protein [Methylococcales bacterium]
MLKFNRINVLVTSFFALAIFNVANANDVKILAVDLYNSNDNSWLVKVTLEHSDTGWDHYADNWQVVDADGNVLGNRILQHPHIKEQPFTRDLAGVKIPDGVTTIYIKAHDKVHGWTTNELKVDLNKVTGRHLRIEAK